MSLLVLPPEMLKEISKYTLPADLARLTHSCRFLYELLRDDLLAQTYGMVKVMGPEGIAVESANSSSRLLRTIKHFPYVADLTTHVVVDWRFYCWCTFVTTYSKCNCISKEEYLLEGVAFEALLTQLRKVQRITFNGLLAPMIRFVVPNLARRSLQRDIPRPADLTGLSHLSLSFHIDDNYGLVDLRLLMWAALISSLKTLDLYDIHINDKLDRSYSLEHLDNWGFGSLTSNVTELNMRDCYIYGKHFRLLLSGFSSLLSLAFEVDELDDESCDPSLVHFCTISTKLPFSIKKSLRKLRLEAEYADLGSLVELTELRRVDISWTMIGDIYDEVVSLADILPASIEEVGLIDNSVDSVMPYERAKILFHRLPEMKPTHFPNLEKIVSSSPIPREIMQACSAVGVAIIYDRGLCHYENTAGIWENVKLPLDKYDEFM